MSPVVVRPAAERGHFDHGWLNTYHTFSFGDYQDREWNSFRALRVINEDVVAPGQGFGMHPHRDMEIITYVLSGKLEHRDSMGNGEVIHAGEVQRMSAGSGVFHSEFNASKTEPVHLLQIWIRPAERGLEPGYEQKKFPLSADRPIELIASPTGEGGSVTLHQDVRVLRAAFSPGWQGPLRIAPGRGVYIHVARGALKLNGRPLATGDGAAIEGEPGVELEGVEEGEALIFDLA